MDNMESIDLGELGRPKKFPRREFSETEDTNETNPVEETTKIATETEDTNKIESAEETTKTEAVPDGCTCAVVLEAGTFIASLGTLDYALPGLTFAYNPAEEARFPVEEAPAPADADADADHGLPSASAVKPRRRPRKGIPRRAPLF